MSQKKFFTTNVMSTFKILLWNINVKVILRLVYRIEIINDQFEYTQQNW